MKALRRQQARLESRRKAWRELPTTKADGFAHRGYDGYHLPGSMNTHKGTGERSKR